jgi:hypothetical protein
MPPLDILYIVLSVFVCILGTLTALILYRTYSMLDRVERILGYIDHVRSLVSGFEKVPTLFIEKLIEKMTK